jgi:integrase
MGTRRASTLLTHRELERAKPDAVDYFLRDGRGLFVRVYPSGRKSFVYRFEVNGRTRRVEHEKPFGNGPDAITLEAARTWRAEQEALRMAGRDPLAAKRTVVTRRRLQLDSTNGEWPSGSFGGLADEFYTRVIVRDFRDPAQFRRILDKDLLPALGRQPIGDIRLADVQAALNRIVDRGSRISANRALLVAKKVFRYARGQGQLEVNPLGDVSRRDVGGKEGERERALTWDEVATFWHVVGAHPGLSWQVRACLQLLLLTGQRIGETLLARWSDIDLDAAEWRIPAANTKTNRAHLVHLPALAVELLRALPKSGTRSYTFHNGDDETDEPITRRAVTRALDRLLTPPEQGKPAALPLAHFTPHDLRRTLRTRLGDLGVLPHVAEKILAHKLGGVLQIYDRAEYLAERQAAMQAWDKKLRELLA